MYAQPEQLNEGTKDRQSQPRTEKESLAHEPATMPHDWRSWMGQVVELATQHIDPTRRRMVLRSPWIAAKGAKTRQPIYEGIS